MQKSNLKIVFLGTPLFVECIKEELKKHFTLVDSLAESDLAVIAAYGHILTEKELLSPKFGCINIHPSLLPHYRGPSPIQTALLNGDKASGITVIQMDKEIDHGPIIYQETFDISGEDNFDTLSTKMFHHSAQILPSLIADFVLGKITPREQNHAQATFCNKLTKESGYFDINNPPTEEVLNRMIRAYYPWPGVWCKFKVQNSKIKIVKLLPSSSHPELVSGSEKFILQMEGKKPVTFRDFQNGYPNFALKF